MSKTVRRKKSVWDFEDSEYDFNIFQRISMDKNSKKYKVKKNRFHSDSYSTWCVPHWYITAFYEKAYRQHTKNEVYKWMKNPEVYEPVIHKYFKDAGYNYW